MVRALPYIVPIALALFALLDLWRSTQVERAQIHPAAWVAIILLPVIGPVAWIVVSRSRRSRAGTGSPAPGRPGPAGPAGRRPTRSGPVAPDDDPDFLWRLEQEQRRRAKGAGPVPGAAPSSPDPGGTGTADDADLSDGTDISDGTVADEEEPPR